MRRRNWFDFKKLVAIGGIAIAYYVAGKLGLLLAMPPGYATAVWPASGIALGAALLLGRRIWPGIAIGSFCVNVGTSFDPSTTSTLLISLAVALGIGIGAALQAVIGARLIERYVGLGNSLEKERDILRFLSLGGPVSCLVSSTIGVSILLSAGVITLSTLLFSWWTWWVGDTIGVLIFTPLMLIACGQPRQDWQHRRFTVGLPLCIAFAVAVGVFFSARSWENARSKLEFEKWTGSFVQAFKGRISDHADLLRSIEGLFLSSESVTRSEFRVFARHLLQTHPDVQALSWNPVILDEQRMGFEEAARRDESPTFEIIERSADGNIMRAPRRPEYVSVLYIEPFEANTSALGFNVASNPKRMEALIRARDEGLPSATGRISLIQDQNGSYGFLLFLPIYRGGQLPESVEARRRNLLGFATGVFKIANLVLDSLEGKEVDLALLQIHDDSAEAGEGLLYGNLNEGVTAEPAAPQKDPAVETVTGLRWATTLDVGGRQWSFLFLPTLKYIEQQQTWHLWLVLASGLLFTSLLGSLLLVMTGRAALISRIVEERTADLQLEIEIRRRAEEAYRSAAQEAQLANRSKSEFLANMSHEIRTPMNGIIGMTEILLGTETTNDQREYLETVMFSSESLLNIINEILDFSKIESRKMTITSVPFEPRSVLKSVIASLEPQARKKGLLLVGTTAAEVPHELIGDPGRVRQILLNVVGNAVKFTKTGNIDVSAGVERFDNDRVMLRFTIADTGIGISEDKISTIFDPFVQADGSSTREFGGTGLGLAISRQLVEMMGGAIRVESQIGQGSQFHVTAYFGVVRE